MNPFWPEINTLEDAKKASHTAAGYCFFIAVVTAVVAYVQTHHIAKLIEGVDSYAYVDAAIFVVIGFFLLRCSRMAALAGLVVYFIEQAVMIQTNGFRFNVMQIIIALGFISAVRATFDYHTMKAARDKAEQQPPVNIWGVPTAPPPPAMEKPEKKSRFFRQVLLLFLALAIFTAAAFIAMKNISAAKAAGGHRFLKTAADHKMPHQFQAAAQKVMSKVEAPAVSGPKKSFKLKDGRTVSGVVTYEDKDYLTLETSSGQVIVIKQDLESPSA